MLAVHCQTPHLLNISMVGINEVSWTLPRPRQPAPTPHLSSLAAGGVALEALYTLPVCSPSRAALLTGTYPFKLGLQRGFGKQTPEGIPTNTPLLPQLLKTAGYTTHGLGKVRELPFCMNR